MVAQPLYARSVGTIADSDTPLAGLAGRDITLVRSNQTVLADVSVSIRPGEITALVGPSGAGKTTLLKALSLVESPTSGSLSIDGISYKFPLAKGSALVAPWPHLTVVFQQLFLWPHLTLRQNIMLPIGKKLDSRRSDYLQHLLKRFDMERFVDRHPNEVSLGQRQRAALVRAMVLEPRYILLDEITSSLDVEQIALILSEIRNLRERGVGIMLITHLLHFAREAADSIVFLEGGRVLASGGKELLTNPSHDRIARFLAMAEIAS